MRLLSLDELELLSGAGNSTGHLSTVWISGVHPPDIPNDPPPSGGGGGGGGTPPPPPCPPAPAPSRQADKQYVFNNEGGLKLTGYWPGGKSGVTIGSGVDLGTVSAGDLKGWGVSQTGITALTPFLGLSGTAASNAVANGPPTLSSADALAASNGVFDKNIGTAVGQFNAQSPVPFDALPPDVQTAVADLAFMTPNLQGAAPRFFADIVSGNWAAAANELLNWANGGTDTSLARHQRDANLINNQIANNTIPGATTCQK